MGNAYRFLGHYQQAIEFYQQELEITREIDTRNWEGSSLNDLGLAYNLLGQYHQAINFHQQALEIAREIGDYKGEGVCLGGLGLVYNSLGHYQRAIEFCQQRLDIAREIGDRREEADAWLNLATVLKNVNRELDALGAYRNARELFQAIGLDAKVQLCNNAIERLSQPKAPVISHRGFWAWLRQLWRWVRAWFRQ
ncbi:tetratricopeptide repeat protein [Nostoc sp.]|uniref:tetratricopeptide repeat protein n=1 Tax=Nostoc sp. TaxID=1180 RepID=UPI002FF72400